MTGALVNGWRVLALGCLLGMRHALDPDHVVAVAALTALAGLGPWMRVATGTLSLVFGAWLILRIGFVDGLVLAHPHWTPR